MEDFPRSWRIWRNESPLDPLFYIKAEFSANIGILYRVRQIVMPLDAGRRQSIKTRSGSVAYQWRIAMF